MKIKTSVETTYLLLNKNFTIKIRTCLGQKYQFPDETLLKHC